MSNSSTLITYDWTSWSKNKNGRYNLFFLFVILGIPAGLLILLLSTARCLCYCVFALQFFFHKSQFFHNIWDGSIRTWIDLNILTRTCFTHFELYNQTRWTVKMLAHYSFQQNNFANIHHRKLRVRKTVLFFALWTMSK